MAADSINEWVWVERLRAKAKPTFKATGWVSQTEYKTLRGMKIAARG